MWERVLRVGFAYYCLNDAKRRLRTHKMTLRARGNGRGANWERRQPVNESVCLRRRGDAQSKFGVEERPTLATATRHVRWQRLSHFTGLFSRLLMCLVEWRCDVTPQVSLGVSAPDWWSQPGNQADNRGSFIDEFCSHMTWLRNAGGKSYYFVYKTVLNGGECRYK